MIIDGHTVDVVALPDNGAGTMDAWGHADLRQAYRCEWDAKFDVMAFLLGYPPGPTYLGVPRDPHRYPGLPAMVALEAEWSGVGEPSISPAGDELVYPTAMIVAKYGVHSYTTGPSDKEDDLPNYAEEHFESRTFVTTMDDRVYRWANGNGAIDHRVGIKTFGWDRVYTLHRVTSINWTNMELALGTINQFEWRGVPPGRLLFSAIDTQRNVGPSFMPFEVTLRMEQRSNHWNQLFRPDRGQWEDITPAPYTFTDFKQIFVFIV